MPKVKEVLQMAPMHFREISEDIIDSVVKEYPEKRAKALLEKQTRWSKENFSPYDLGFNCNAYHFFTLTLWDQRPAPDPDLLEIFHEGVLHEPDVIDKLKSAGFEVSGFNVPFSLKWGTGLTVRGKIDLFLRYSGVQIPCEAKSMSSYAFNSINRWEDMLVSKSSFHRCYPYQLVTYLHACNKSKWGLFVLKDKQSGKIKLIKMPYSDQMIEEIQNRVLVVSKLFQKKQGDLEQMKVKDPLWCGRCDFRFQCLGNDGEKMVPLLEDAELEALLLRREELKPFNSEYDKIDKNVKLALKGKEEVLIGDFLVTGKETERNGYVVEPTKFWTTKIIYKGNKTKEVCALND